MPFSRHKSDRKSSYGDAVKELDSAVGEIADLLVKMKIENKVMYRQHNVQIAFHSVQNMGTNA